MNLESVFSVSTIDTQNGSMGRDSSGKDRGSTEDMGTDSAGRDSIVRMDSHTNCRC